MKISNNNIIAIINLINKCADNVTGKTAYAMLRNRQKLVAELKPFEEAREQLIKRYGSVDESGNMKLNCEPGSDDYTQFITELTELFNINIDIDLYQISEDEFNLEFTDDLKLSEYDLLHRIIVK